LTPCPDKQDSALAKVFSAGKPHKIFCNLLKRADVQAIYHENTIFIK
jgi:hypothetical protein